MLMSEDLTAAMTANMKTGASLQGIEGLTVKLKAPVMW